MQCLNVPLTQNRPLVLQKARTHWNSSPVFFAEYVFAISLDLEESHKRFQIAYEKIFFHRALYRWYDKGSGYGNPQPDARCKCSGPT
jgi:hypothetical protein